MLIIDIDNFKYINDNFDHLQGDIFLKASDILINNLRSSDIISR
ncbi:MAG: diguanylate cyclase [Caldisericia bacterium]|nr:diguanylate cyclase [Caldisericia bacterium]